MEQENKLIFEGLNKAQYQAVSDIEGPQLIIAGACSGKTKVLTCRIANILSKGHEPGSILALTFTNKAAREMKERIARYALFVYYSIRGIFERRNQHEENVICI